MKEDGYLQTPDEHTRASDKFFLEFAIKKCSLTLSKEEILSQTKRLLGEIFDVKVEKIPIEYREYKTDTAAADFTSDESALSGRSRDVPEDLPVESGKAVSEKQKKKKAGQGGPAKASYRSTGRPR